MKNADVDIASGRGLKAFAVRHQMALFVPLTLIISGHLSSRQRWVNLPLLSPADQERYWLIMVAVECLTALGVLIATRGRVGLGPTNQRLRDG